MKRFISALLIASFILTLVGCSELTGTTATTTPEDGVVEDGIPVGALMPVYEDEENGVKSTKIELADFTLTLPDGYAYAIKEYTAENAAGKSNTYNTYFVWLDAYENRDYVFETDTNIMFYVIEGVDTDSPHPTLDKRTARVALRTVYLNYFINLVGLKNGLYEAETALNSNEKYWTFCFTGNSGEYVTTSYGDTCFPNSYSGFFVVESETDDSDRNFYGFAFSNDDTGEIFRESEYNDLMSQIKNQFAITEFDGTLEHKVDVKGGYSYENLVTDALYTNDDGKVMKRGIFYNTLMYYVITTGRSHERIIVDGVDEQTVLLTIVTSRIKDMQALQDYFVLDIMTPTELKYLNTLLGKDELKSLSIDERSAEVIRLFDEWAVERGSAVRD